MLVVINTGPRKPRRLNLNDVWNEYRGISQHNDEGFERQNVCLETCFTTFPETTVTVVPPKVEPIKKLTFVHKIENVDITQKILAPLAQPEYFSDTSSLTSSNSNWETVHENVVEIVPDPVKVGHVMKRTPKIIGNLSTCVDDIRNVKTFEKLVKASHLNDKSNSSSNVSSTSGLSGRTNCSNEQEHFVSLGNCSWQRTCDSDKVKSTSLAEDLLEEILEYAECAEFFKSDNLLNDYGDQLFDGEYKRDETFKMPTLKFSETCHSSPLILSPSSLDIDPDVISNYAIDLNLDQEHRSLLSYQNLHSSILKVQGNCNGSNSPLCSKTVTFNPDVQSIDDKVEPIDIKKEKFNLWTYIQSHFIKKTKHTDVEISTSNVPTISSNSDKCVEPLLNTFKSDCEYT